MSEKNVPLTKLALGRPFQLGTLYDCRSDSIVVGLSLWEKKDIAGDSESVPKTKYSSPKKYSSVHVIAGESLDSKTLHIDADIDIKLSLMNDMIDVHGSAHFLAEDVNSDEHNRIVVHYSSTSRFDQLLITEDMQKAAKDNIGEVKMATHVVTGILYGADAYFVFDMARKEDTTKLEVQGKLEATVNGLSGIGFGGSIEGGLSKEDQLIAEKLSCSFHGDVILDPLPSNYHEAMESYRNLTEKIGAGKYDEKTVPMKVWLLPLSALNVPAPSYVKKINETRSTRAQRALESLHSVKVAATALLSSCICDLDEYSPFLDCIRKQIKEFLSLVDKQRLSFILGMKRLLPQIRAGNKNEADLDDLIFRMTHQLFDPLGLRNWLETKRDEVNILKELLRLVEAKKHYLAKTS